MAPRKRIRWLSLPLTILAGATIALAQQGQPLKPADRSSPRAAIQTFLESGDTLRSFLARDYLPSPSRARYETLEMMAGNVSQGLDLSQVAPAARPKAGYAAANALYEVLSRIPLPEPGQIPGADQLKPARIGVAQQWVIPETEIVLVRSNAGPHGSEFLFSADTVARADEFYARVRGLPYTRPVPLQNMPELVSAAGGWMIPYAWVRALPSSLRAPIAGQSAWKWVGLALILGMLVLFLAITYRAIRRGDGLDPLPRALARLAMPVAVLLAMPVIEHLALVQLVLADSVGSAIELATTGTTILASAWLAWRIASVVAEAILAWPREGPEFVDPHIVRAGASLLGIAAAAAMLTLGADRVGLPLYGILAGLGVGGLAVALAAQSTIENLIGGISLVADKAVRRGELLMYGDAQGTVEAVGLRATRIRGDDRTLTNIPNAVLAKLPIVSLSRRDQMLIQAVLGLRCETTPEQLRYVLATLRELLLGHPRIDRDPARVRFIGFGAYTLDVEVFAYVKTRDYGEFLAVREELLLRVMDILQQGGIDLAYPSQTLYLGRDPRAPGDASSDAPP